MTYDPEKARAYRLRAKYGLTVAEYGAILGSQDGRCAICRKPPRPGKHLAVDHDHRMKKTIVVRGLLCSFCNSSRLGRGNESAELHRACADYLDHGAERVARIREATGLVSG